MEPQREHRPAAHTGLRDAWRRRSLATGWLTADDWYSKAVDAVIAACHDGRPASGEAGLAPVGDGSLIVACAGLGRSRARAGIGIAETIDDLAALFAVLDSGPGHERSGPAGKGSGLVGGCSGPAGERSGDPPLHLVCAIADGWAEESLAQLAQGGCEDPLSGLATLPYLRTRLAEVYREAEQAGTSPADTHRLLVVGLPRRPDPWRRMTLAILVGQDLRAAFPGGETLSMAKPGPAIALVRARGDLPLRYARLRRSIQVTFGTQIRMTPLPGLFTEALRLVDELAH
jgi:hypothetical protein